MTELELDLKKLNEIRKSKCLTYKQLAQITEISQSTITKLFGGFSKNPTLTHLKKIAKALDCSLDDFLKWEQEPTSPYYLDRKTAEMAQEIHDNPDLRILFDASKNLSPEDIQAIVEIAKRIQATKK